MGAPTLVGLFHIAPCNRLHRTDHLAKESVGEVLDPVADGVLVLGEEVHAPSAFEFELVANPGHDRLLMETVESEHPTLQMEEVRMGQDGCL